MKQTVTLEEAFSLVVSLFKKEQNRRDNAERCLEWITSHDATAAEYKSMAKRYFEAKAKAEEDEAKA